VKRWFGVSRTQVEKKNETAVYFPDVSTTLYVACTFDDEFL